MSDIKAQSLEGKITAIVFHYFHANPVALNEIFEEIKNSQNQSPVLSDEKITEAVNEFTEKYIHNSAIKQVVFDNVTNKWSISYTYDAKDDTFDSFQEMIEWLYRDQY